MLRARSPLKFLIARKLIHESTFHFVGRFAVKTKSRTVDPIDCKAVVTPEGGRRLVPLSGVTQQKISKLEKSFEDSSATVNEFGTDRIRLDRYLAAAWDVRVMKVERQSDLLLVERAKEWLLEEENT